MRRVSTGALALLVLGGILFGSIAGAVVGAVTAMTAKPVQKTVYVTARSQSSQSASPAEQKVLPTTNAAGVVNRAGPAVVTIIHQLPSQTDLFGNTEPGGEALGSGFFIDHNGDIVTNAHVVSGAHTFTVIFANGKKTNGTLVGENDLNDIAVVKVSGPVPAVVHFGNSAQILPGEPVIAIGNALGEFQNTVTEGVVSGLHRTIPGFSGQDMHDMVQTDAAINHGNSGGPLLDLNGDVVGINTAIERSTQTNGDTSPFGITDPNEAVAEGLGFAIPSNIAAPLVQRIISHGPPAFLGVEYHAISQQEAQVYNLPTGAYVLKVVAGGPAAKAGLKARDVITSIGGVSIGDNMSLEQVVANYKPGDRVKLKVWRNGEKLTLLVTLGVGH
jgi:2-alkenal reductase